MNSEPRIISKNFFCKTLDFFFQLCYYISHGVLAQLEARHTGSVEVTGSNPVCSTKPRDRRTHLFHWHFLSLDVSYPIFAVKNKSRSSIMGFGFLLIFYSLLTYILFSCRLSHIHVLTRQIFIGNRQVSILCGIFICVIFL